jgi:hypothetical protein
MLAVSSVRVPIGPRTGSKSTSFVMPAAVRSGVRSRGGGQRGIQITAPRMDVRVEGLEETLQGRPDRAGCCLRATGKYDTP